MVARRNPTSCPSGTLFSLVLFLRSRRFTPNEDSPSIMFTKLVYRRSKHSVSSTAGKHPSQAVKNNSWHNGSERNKPCRVLVTSVKAPAKKSTPFARELPLPFPTRKTALPNLLILVLAAFTLFLLYLLITAEQRCPSQPCCTIPSSCAQNTTRLQLNTPIPIVVSSYSECGPSERQHSVTGTCTTSAPGCIHRSTVTY